MFWRQIRLAELDRLRQQAVANLGPDRAREQATAQPVSDDLASAIPLANSRPSSNPASTRNSSTSRDISLPSGGGAIDPIEEGAKGSADNDTPRHRSQQDVELDQGEERTVEFIRTLRLDDLPQSYISLLKLCLLDTLGATIAGSLAPIEGVITKYLDQVGGNPVSSIVMGGGRASAIAYAAWANAGLANALDICDSSKYSRGHPGAMIVPTALAVGEASRCSGRDFLEALAVGYEVAMYAGDCWFHHQQPMQSCGSWGSLACAATAARLLKLDKSSTRDALGLAEFYAPGSPMLRSVREPSMAKSAISAGAMTGVQVAQQAAAGHTSITSLLADPKYDSWMRQIGRVFLLPSGIEWKPWGACAWGQPAVGAAYSLVVEHRIRLDRIEAIHIRTFDKANELYQGPVSTPEEAQYNIKWPLAALLVHGQVGPNQTLPHQFSDPRILELYGRIFIHRDQEAEEAFRRFDTDCGGTDGAFGGGSAEIRLKNDGAFTKPIANSAGMRWDRGVVEGKFCWLSGYRLDASQIGSLIHLVGAIETLDTIKPLLDHLRFPAAEPSNRLTPPPSSASLEYSPPPPEWFLQLMRLNGYL